MFSQVIDGIHININLEPGIYMFDDFSSTGKTYLCKLLKKLRTFGYPVDGYNYDDYLRKISLKQLVGKLDGKIECLEIDRYVLYKEEFHDYIKELGKYCVVLIDCKDYVPLPFEYATVMLKRANLLEVE